MWFEPLNVMAFLCPFFLMFFSCIICRRTLGNWWTIWRKIKARYLTRYTKTKLRNNFFFFNTKLRVAKWELFCVGKKQFSKHDSNGKCQERSVDWITSSFQTPYVKQNKQWYLIWASEKIRFKKYHRLL